jgi:hypothetical protein
MAAQHMAAVAAAAAAAGGGGGSSGGSRGAHGSISARLGSGGHLGTAAAARDGFQPRSLPAGGSSGSVGLMAAAAAHHCYAQPHGYGRVQLEHDGGSGSEPSMYLEHSTSTEEPDEGGHGSRWGLQQQPQQPQQQQGALPSFALHGGSSSAAWEQQAAELAHEQQQWQHSDALIMDDVSASFTQADAAGLGLAPAAPGGSGLQAHAPAAAAGAAGGGAAAGASGGHGRCPVAAAAAAAAAAGGAGSRAAAAAAPDAAAAQDASVSVFDTCRPIFDASELQQPWQQPQQPQQR